MENNKKLMRSLLAGAVAATLATQVLAGNAEPIKVGVMLPFSGVYAALGDAGRNGLKMALMEHAGELHGRQIKYIEMDTEAKPERAPEIASSLLDQHHADFIIGPVHSGVAMGMIKVLKGKDTIMIIPNAGANAATGPLCAPNIFRTSFSSWQPSYPMGQVALNSGYKRVVTMSWNYSMGNESLDAFEEAFKAGGGEVVKRLLVPFPKTEFQSYLTEIGSINPDAVFVFFGGSGAIKFVKDYEALGLKGKIPLLSSGFITEGTLDALGNSAEGLMTTLHYSEDIDNEVNRKFRKNYEDRYGKPADIFAVQGYDAGLLIAQAVNKLDGDISNQGELINAMETAHLRSPRGDITFSRSHNPIQNIYLRQVVDGKNKIIDVPAAALEDPGRGCKL